MLYWMSQLGVSVIQALTNEANVGDKYNFSLFGRPAGKSNKLLIRLVDAGGTVQGETSVTVSSRSWKTYKAVLTGKKASVDVHLEIQPQSAGEVDLDMISLFQIKYIQRQKEWPACRFGTDIG